MVSVIVPAYNVADYLEECIDSILEQTYTDIECIIVDDGSTDKGTYDLCEKIKQSDERVKVVHKDNEGPKRARADGVLISSGDYLMFVDADDWLDKTIIESCMRAMAHTKADIISFDYVTDSGKIGFHLQQQEIIDARTAVKNLLSLCKMDGNMCYKFYKRKVFDGISFDNRPHCDFVNIIHIMEKADNILLLPKVGYWYRKRKGSLSYSDMYTPKQEEYVYAAYEVYKTYQEDLYIKEEAEFYWLYALLWVCIKMEKDRKFPRTDERFKNVKEMLRKEIKRYMNNRYSRTKEKLQYLLCYLNLFRTMFMVYTKCKRIFYRKEINHV